MASRIVPHPEAFSLNGRGQRRPREKQKTHRDFIARLPCLVRACGHRMSVVAAHIRIGDPRYGKCGTGYGEKSSDRWTLPLCAKHHAIQHSIGNELQFWREEAGVADPLLLALILWGLTDDIENAEVVVELWRTRGLE
jgi:hypothetical protein